MRELTILRKKSFVGCITALKVYIEDPEHCDLVINGLPCRFLGKLKNGGQVVFEISEKAAKVFVIAGKVSKDYCNDCYALPEGEESVRLEGVCKFNPASGNAFRFDGNEGHVNASERKKKTLKGAVILLIALAVGFCIGYFGVRGLFSIKRPKDFNLDGMNITLNSDFGELEKEEGGISVYSKKIYVYAAHDPFIEIPNAAIMNVKDYGELVVEANNVECDGVKEQDGLTYCEYDKTTENESTHTILFFYRGTNDFWVVNFVTHASDTASCRDQIFKFASSVKFDE